MFAGCLIDAFFACIPVIATDWLYNKDIIKNNVNCILVPFQSPHKISVALLDLYFNRELALEISKNNAIEAKKYTAENVLAGLYNYLDK